MNKPALTMTTVCTSQSSPIEPRDHAINFHHGFDLDVPHQEHTFSLLPIIFLQRGQSAALLVISTILSKIPVVSNIVVYYTNPIIKQAINMIEFDTCSNCRRAI